MKIGIDLDSTLNRLDLAWSQWIQDTHDPEFTMGQWTGWNIHDLCKAGKKVYDFLDEPGTFLNLPVFEGSQDVVRELQAAGHDIIVVTACSLKPGRGQIVDDKLTWLARHFPSIPHESICIMHRKGLMELDVLIDDGPHNFDGFKGECLLIDGSWNRHATQYKRVTGWGEIREHFKEMGDLP